MKYSVQSYIYYAMCVCMKERGGWGGGGREDGIS